MEQDTQSHRWDASQIPDVRGKVAVITGSNSGIGFEAARMLATAGVHIIMAVRNVDKGRRAVEDIQSRVINKNELQLDVYPLDLADLDSVQRFPDHLVQNHVESLDLLINNAGVMAPPLQRTKQGFELQFGTNYLGHFALTGRLLPLLEKSPKSRIVTVSSMAHRGGRIDFQNFTGSQGYKRWREYSQSKLADLIFAYELQRRFKRFSVGVISVACHPGFAATNLVSAGFTGTWGSFGTAVAKVGNLAAQSAAMGALPTVYAATHEGLVGGEYIGPLGRGGMRGFPGIVDSTKISKDEALAQRLWEASEQLTGVKFLSD